eukprot:9481499-Pyramimonas_sp.AAC.1
MSPKDLQNTDFLTLIGGVIAAPDRHTYESAGAQSLIDYFVVHPLLSAAVKREVWETPLIPKHQPVALALRGNLHSDL